MTRVFSLSEPRSAVVALPGAGALPDSSLSPLPRKRLPTSIMIGTTETNTMSGFVSLLNYMEQRALYDAWNVNVQFDVTSAPGFPADRYQHTTVAQTRVAAYACPSDTSAPTFNLSNHNPKIPLVAVGSYAFCAGSQGPPNTTAIKIDNDGFSHYLVPRGIHEFLDGSSQTVCISETVKSELGGPVVWDAISPTNGFVLTRGNDNSANGPELTDYLAQCSGPGLRLQQTRGSRWVYGAPGHSMYNHLRPPNDKSVDCRGGLPHSSRTNFWWDRLSHNVAARSAHPGGVNASTATGSKPRTK